MVGVITGWSVLSHPVVTIRCFGWRVFFRAVFAGRNRTFLSLLTEVQAFESRPAKTPPAVQRCVGLELAAARIYDALAQKFALTPLVCDFFIALACQEQEHADLLRLCRFAAERGAWQHEQFNPWSGYVARLEEQMAEIEAGLPTIQTVEDALRLTMVIESSEVNNLFSAVVAATDSKFVARVNAFHAAHENHIRFICERVTELAPDLMPACRELRGKYLKA
jgi:hypothetical protein